MLIFMLRYFFVYWILLGSSASEQTLFRDLNLEAKDFPIASCKLRCMHPIRKSQYVDEATERHNNWADQYCTKHCPRENATISLDSEKYSQARIPYRMTLVCRDDRSLTFHITSTHLSNIESLSEDSEKNKVDSSATKQHETAEDKYKSIKFSRDDVDQNVFTVPVIVKNASQPQRQATMTNPDIDTQQMRQQSSDAIFMVTIQSGINVIIFTSHDNFFTITDLESSTTYKIFAVSVNAKYEYAIVTSNQEFSTLPHQYTPGLVREMYVNNFLADETNEMHLKAEISWNPPEDRTCHYNILYFDENEVSDMTPKEIRNPRKLYTYTMENLTFSAIYKVGIRAINTNNSSKESKMGLFQVEVPSCTEWYNNNFNICSPLTPEGLDLTRIYLRENTYALNITWQKTEHPLSNYVVMVVDHNEDGGRDYKYFVDRNANMLFIPEVELNGTFFDVHLIAYTPGGNASAVLQKANSHMLLLPDKSQPIVKVILAVLAPIFCAVILSLATFIIYHRRAKMKRYQERCKYFEDLEKKAPIDPKANFDFPTKNLLTSPEDLTLLQLDLEEIILFNDAMEIDRKDITLHEILGEGAFGLVRRGTYSDGKLGTREVAVKMLKDRPSVDDVRAFRREIEVMKSVERHPNIVGIIGHCTKRYNEMLLLTEYCSFGNLLDFLRDEWKYLYDLNIKCNSAAVKRISSRLHRHNTKKEQRRRGRSIPQTHRRNCHESKSNSNSNSNSSHSQYHMASKYKYKSGIFGGGNVGGGGVFNIDSNIIERLKFKYKNLNALQQKCTTTAAAIYPPLDDVSATTTMTSITTTNDSAPPPPPTPLHSSYSTAADNKSYGYDEVCSITCKHHIDFDIGVKDSELISRSYGDRVTPQSEHKCSHQPEQRQRQRQQQQQQKRRHCIYLKNFDLQSNLLNEQQAMRHKGRTVARASMPTGAFENKSYFKFLPEILSEAALRQRQWQRRQVRAAARNRIFALKETQTENSTTTTFTSATTVDNGGNDTLSASLRREPLSTADLLDIARQAAVGMEFLAKNKVVHRDLAARNVLVAPDRTIKIADFGLSRDIYQENVYKKTGNGKLPIKWLALESMTHQVYTTQSDVWSYGILLYEIVTLGGTPYPSIPTNRLLHLLKTGYRMEQPKNCGPEFYNLMYDCWNVHPGERPTFTEIIKILENFLTDEPELQIENILGVPNLECIGRFHRLERPNQQLHHQDLQQNQQFQEQPQTPLDDGEEMMDASLMDDSYLKPL